LTKKLTVIPVKKNGTPQGVPPKKTKFMDTKQIASILQAKNIYGNSESSVERIIIRAATAAALPDSMYFDLRRFKDPANPIERMYKMGVRVFVVVNFDDNMQRNYPDATFIVVENINTAINLYINAVIDAYKGRVIAVPQRGGNCCLKDWKIGRAHV